MDRLDWKYFLVYVGWLAVELTYVFVFVIETKDRTLEETAAMFDGDDTVAEIAFRASMHAGIDFPGSSTPTTPLELKQKDFPLGLGQEKEPEVLMDGELRWESRRSWKKWSSATAASATESRSDASGETLDALPQVHFRN